MSHPTRQIFAPQNPELDEECVRPLQVTGSSVSRENSVSTSESPISEADEHDEPATPGGGRRKTVSFSEQVDTTSYKSNATISALHSTLKVRLRQV